MTEGLLVLSGPPCSGKSSIARLLAAGVSQRDRSYIEIDRVFSALFPWSDRNRGDRMLAYDAAHAAARVLLEQGRAVALECTYSRLDQRISLARAVANLPETPVWVVECFVTPEDAVARFVQRSQETDLDEQLLYERVKAFPYSDESRRLVSSRRADSGRLAAEVEVWLDSGPAAIAIDAWVRAGKGWD